MQQQERPQGQSSGSADVAKFSRNPWELLGRVVHEESVALKYDERLNQGLIRSAAARESGLEYEEFEARLEARCACAVPRPPRLARQRLHPPSNCLCWPRPALQRLLTLMPFLQRRLLRIQPKLLAALAADPDLIAARLIQLKTLLPAADVAAVAGQRPSLLLDAEWQRVPVAVSQLLARYSEEEAAFLASREPLLLAEDVEAVLAELARYEGCGVGGQAGRVLCA